MKSIKTFAQLEDFGRVRLSKNFFMREFLHSEISQIERVPNIPENPDVPLFQINGEHLRPDMLKLQKKYSLIKMSSSNHIGRYYHVC